MNVVIIGSSSGYPYVSYISTGNDREKVEKVEKIEKAYQCCVDCMLQSEEYEKGDIVTEVTVVYNGRIYEFLLEKQLIEFFKTI